MELRDTHAIIGKKPLLCAKVLHLVVESLSITSNVKGK